MKTRKSSRESVHKLKLLLEFGKRIVAERNLDSLLTLLAKEAKVILNAERCTIFFLDKKKKLLWSRIAQGTHEIITFPLEKGIAGESVRRGKLLNVKNAYRDPRHNAQIAQEIGYKVRSILTAPMKNLHNEILGAFQVLNKKSGKPFDKEDEKILIILSSQAAVAIENTNLYHQVRQATQDTIFRLAAAAEYKDKDTASHLIRMSRYSSLIAEELGYSKKYCENIRLASPMHDIGKLGVPDAILMKPGKLTEEEWEEMKKHPLYGAEILMDSQNELIQMSERIALSHHEKYDGSGYPKGLKGEEIPMEGRIVALADVFDALTSKRIYKEKFSLDETVKIIRAGSGQHFDPKVIQAFEKVLPKIIKVMNDLMNKPKEFHRSHPKENSPHTEPLLKKYRFETPPALLA